MPTDPLPTRPRGPGHGDGCPESNESEGKEKTAASKDLKVEFVIYFERLSKGGKRSAGTIAENLLSQEGLPRLGLPVEAEIATADG